MCQIHTKDQATTKLVVDALRLRHEAYRFCGHSATCPRLAKANALLQSQPYCSHAVQSSRIKNNQRGRDSCKRISLCVQRGSSCIQDPCLLMSKSYCRASAAGRTLPQFGQASWSRSQEVVLEQLQMPLQPWASSSAILIHLEHAHSLQYQFQ